MAARKKEMDIFIEHPKETILKVELVGTSDLILNKKSRSFERYWTWLQTHDDGEKVPSDIDTNKKNYNIWEHLITSITWLETNPYVFDDYSKYTEEMWHDLMTNNAPCILSAAFKGSMGETFTTFGFKDSTNRAGTDLKRAVNFTAPKFPVTFAAVEYEQKLVPNTGINKTNVVAQYNLFHGWKCRVEIACADIVFPSKTIIELLSTAGKYVGVGTQRKNGYGRWKLGNIEEIKVG